MRTATRMAAALAVLALGPASAAEVGPSTAAVKGAQVHASTTPTVGSIYTVDRLRDPFATATGSSGGGSGKPFTAEDFNIHNLSLRGLMKDAGTAYALFTDAQFGVTFILRSGKLYDPKGKPVKGVSGSLDLKKKTAHLMTQDKDVQVFTLGEKAEDEAGP